MLTIKPHPTWRCQGHPPHEGEGRLHAQRIANRIQRFQCVKFFRPNLSPLFRRAVSCLHLEAREERTYGDRCGFRGWSSGKRSLVALSGDFATGSGQVPCNTGRNPGGEGIGGRGRHGLKSPMRSGMRQHPARRGPPSERVKNPRSEGFWKTVHAKRSSSSKRYSNQSYSGRGPGASHPSQSLSEQSREAAKPRLHNASPCGGGVGAADGGGSDRQVASPTIDNPKTPPTDRCAITSPTGGGL